MRKKTKHFRAESRLDLLFMIMRIPNRIHTSNVTVIALKEV